jgi:hypothetical protein
MTKHKTDDYKISAVKYYLNNDKGDAYNAINKKERPNYLSRSNHSCNSSGFLEEFPNQNLHALK